MDHTAIRAQLPALVSGFLPSNARRFRFSIHDGRPLESALGFHVDPEPFEGKVVPGTTMPSSFRPAVPSSRSSTEG